MKESILDVLLYLFEHYFTNEDVAPDVRDRDSLQKDLLQAGFSPAEVTLKFRSRALILGAVILIIAALGLIVTRRITD